MIHLLKGYMKTLRKISKVSLTPPGYLPRPTSGKKFFFKKFFLKAFEP